MLLRDSVRAAACLVAALVAAGCGGGDKDPGASGSGSAQPASPGTVEKARQTVETVVTQAQQVVKAVEQTAEKAQAVAVQAAAQAQEYLDQAKALLAEKKVQEASGVLEKLAGMALTEDQQRVLGGLKTEAAQILKDVEKGLSDLKATVAAKDYTGATALVSKLASYQFSPEQQKLYDDLKGQVKRLMESQAMEQGAKSLNNLLGR